jgi:hypothetical protein
VYTSAQPYKRRQIVVGNTTEEAYGHAQLVGQPSQAVARRDRWPDIASTRSGREARSCAAARIAVSKPFRGTSLLMDTITSASIGRPNFVRAASRSSSLSGRNRSVSTPGGNDGDRKALTNCVLGLCGG